ncbi:MAG: T9SS type A sorting domain-containing protein [Flavobacteriales bacterium]
MRTLTLLISLTFLLPFLGKAQSVTIDYAFDSSSTYGCDTVGESIYHYVYGSSTGLTSGDTIDILADWDDGNGLQLVDQDTVNSNGSFSSVIPHSFSSTGTKNVQFVAIGPNGNSDTIYNTLFITDSCTTIQGKVYVDQDGNCAYNTGEPLLSYRSVKVEYGSGLVGYGNTDGSGQYQIEVPAGQSPYEVTLTDSGSYGLACPSSGTQQVSNPPSYTTDFALDCSSNTDFSVDYGSVWNFRPGWVDNIYMGFDGPADCQDSLECIKMVLPQELQPLATDSTTPSYDAINGDTVVWNLDTNTMSDFQYSHLPVMTDTSATVGDTLCVEILLCASSDVDPSNNSMTICEEVVNSWDPNNKKVLPRGVGPANHIDKNQRMTYTVNFQNTGTAPAVDIRIEDTLDTDVLDQNSFKLVASSHPVDKIKIEEDSIFEFHFDNIMLPDSGTSKPGSKGFVRFSVDQESNLSDGTVIENNAAIFFDQNAPVITNETMNTIGSPSSIAETREAPRMSVFPNPAEEQLHIRSSELKKGQVVLRDMVGKQVLRRELDGSRTTLDLNALPSGVYLLSVRAADYKEPFRKKVLIH